MPSRFLPYSHLTDQQLRTCVSGFTLGEAASRVALRARVHRRTAERIYRLLRQVVGRLHDEGAVYHWGSRRLLAPPPELPGAALLYGLVVTWRGTFVAVVPDPTGSLRASIRGGRLPAQGGEPFHHDLALLTPALVLHHIPNSGAIEEHERLDRMYAVLRKRLRAQFGARRRDLVFHIKEAILFSDERFTAPVPALLRRLKSGTSVASDADGIGEEDEDDGFESHGGTHDDAALTYSS